MFYSQPSAESLSRAMQSLQRECLQLGQADHATKQHNAIPESNKKLLLGFGLANGSKLVKVLLSSNMESNVRKASFCPFSS
jgi:hypothetical protein